MGDFVSYKIVLKHSICIKKHLMVMKEDNIIRISFLGDIMCTIPMTQKAEQNSGYCFTSVFENIRKYLESSDYVVGNLETPLAGSDCLFTFHPTEFNSPDEFAMAVKEAGIDMVTTANNHALDRGLYGLRRTISVLDEIGLEHVGTQLFSSSERTFYKGVNGMKCAFVSYTYDTNSQWMNNKLATQDRFYVNLFKEQEAFPFGGVGNRESKIRKVVRSLVPDLVKDILRDKSKVDCGTINDVSSSNNKRYEEQLYSDIKKAKDNSDCVFVCLHIGGQYNDNVGAYTQAIVNGCKEAGAKYIICNHPHCVLPISLDCHDNLVTYALGNFCYTPYIGYYVHGKYSEYSIILHLQFSEETKNLHDIRFSIIKSINRETNTQIYNVFDLYNEEKMRPNELEHDVRKVLQRFLNRKISKVCIKSEYSLYEFI